MTKTLAAIVLATLTALPLTCQVPDPGKGDPFVFDAGVHEVTALVDRVAAYLGYEILYDSNEVQAMATTGGQIRLLRRTEVDRDGCWELACSLLHARGFAILPLDADRGFFELVAINGPRGADITNRAEFVQEQDLLAYADKPATPVLTVLQLHSINANLATNALRPFFAQAGGQRGSLTFGTAGSNTSLLLQGFGPQVYGAAQLVRLVDVKVDAPILETQVRRLEHTAPEDLEPILTAILACRSRVRAQALVEATAAAAIGAPIPQQQVDIVIDPAHNALVLTGTGDQVDEVIELIARLDQPRAAARQVPEDFAKRLAQLEDRIKTLEPATRGGK